MLNDINGEAPELAPPGAGLPLLELWVARWIFRWGRWRSSRADAVAGFAKEREEILRLASGCDPVAATRRVLIQRLPGMEDSSRNWSVCMTLDHLRITNDAVSGTIGSLVAGHVPLRPASTADVKPSGTADLSGLSGFRDSCRRLEAVVSASPDLATRARYAHPWFGPLDASGWHFMAGFHLRLHRRQIECIRFAL